MTAHRAFHYVRDSRGHIRGALNNGATREEIYEVFAQAAGYCGLPASNGAVRLYVQVLKEEGLL